MEEELNDNELEERLYALLHHVDVTQPNVECTVNKGLGHVDNLSGRSTLRRYWHTIDVQQAQAPITDTINSNTTGANNINTTAASNSTINNTPACHLDTKPKEEKRQVCAVPESPPALAEYQSPAPQDTKPIEISGNNSNPHIVELDTSDEDEVIEIALPPKPTITIDSSDDEHEKSPQKPNEKTRTIKEKVPNKNDREVSASPVPSVVSSVSDEFIRGDCIALNISSRRPDNHSFDFSLHGSDLLDQSAPSRKKKKKKNKDCVTSTPTAPDASVIVVDDYFATPKSKAKNKKQDRRYAVTEASIPSADVYDSDSNQSVTNTNKSDYAVTDRSLPSADVYESDSNASENKEKSTKSVSDLTVNSADHGKPQEECLNTNNVSPKEANSVIDLTCDLVTPDRTGFEENIIMANVTGYWDFETHNGPEPTCDPAKLGSTRVPAILYEDLDFDNLKGKDKVCRRRRYSLTTLRAEMEKFYNESWGGENFNHREIQKNMSRDKSLWAIDPKDRIPTTVNNRRKTTCNYCNRPGHRDDMCRMKPPVCYMCGSTGHYEPRCPRKICVNCGSPNQMYSTMCRNCASWGRITCQECGQNGHPATHCPDVWRRYHNTTDNNEPLAENHQIKKHYQMFCSGCSRRGHLVHTCRISLPFSGLPINSPYVTVYRPVYAQLQNCNYPPNNYYNQKNCKQFHNKTFPQDSTISSVMTPFRGDRNKRQSKSPITNGNHLNKKRNTMDYMEHRTAKSPVNENPQRKRSHSKESTEEINKPSKEPNKNTNESAPKLLSTEKALDFIPIGSSNHDKKGQIIQDNEVSDTSDVITSARIYLTNEIIDILKTEEGDKWLKQSMEKHKVIVEHANVNLFLNIKGKVGDQEAFQSEFRDWVKNKTNKAKSGDETDLLEQNTGDKSVLSNHIPKNRNNVLRKLNDALESLNQDLGDPHAIYKELNYLQNHHQQLLKQKVVSPKQVSNNRVNINKMLKTLNMVLLGQAGLADGRKHVDKLYALQARLFNSRKKNIPVDLRQEIGQHYEGIFTAMPRDDYADLLNKYYVSKPMTCKKKKKKENYFKHISEILQRKNFVAISSKPKIRNIEKNTAVIDNIADNNNPNSRDPLLVKTRSKLVFYHKKIKRAKPIDNVLKMTQIELLKKLSTHIVTLSQHCHLAVNSKKKVKKLQNQAELFLSNL